MAATDKLVFVPSKSVTFMPNGSKQMAEMTVANESDKTIMFKMKSTRPGMFKMRPVYGAVAPSEKTTVRLIFKGLKSGQEAPRKESDERCKGVLIDEQLNDWGDAAEERNRMDEPTSRRCRGNEIDCLNQRRNFCDCRFTVVAAVAPSTSINTEKSKSAANVIVKKEIVQAPPKKLVVVMYRDQKDDSVSGDDDDDDDPTTTCTTVQQNTNKQQTEKTNPERRQQQSNVATKSAAQKSTLGGKSAMSAATAAKQGDQQTNREATKSAAVTQKSVLTKSMTTSELNVKTAKLSPAFDIKKVKAEVAANVPAARVQSFTVDPDDAGAKTCQQNKAFNNNQQSEYAK
ncbi:MSP domain protein [Dictyocaulus viviparus]|uniref:Major sperm protein n=1 Tax=Dictyocaulus viviparus TaxID=29172 RepID=A0A0D8XLX4_DICVI|nr:MSP domain protein [Dictyocaulus viviparus]